MGNCMVRMKAEMQAPPQDMTCKSIAPRRAPHAAEASTGKAQRKPLEFDANGAPLRRETASGIPGLTYDQAGRPVWRDPALKWNGDEVKHEHFEGKKVD